MKLKDKTQKTKKEESLKEELINVVKVKEERLKIKERGQKGGIMSALASFGILGWNLIVPVILMLIIGKIIAEKFNLGDAWIMNFLFIGLGIGIYNCYKEIRKEYRKGLRITGEIKKED